MMEYTMTKVSHSRTYTIFHFLPHISLVYVPPIEQIALDGEISKEFPTPTLMDDIIQHKESSASAEIHDSWVPPHVVLFQALLLKFSADVLCSRSGF